MNWRWFETLANSSRTSAGVRGVGLVLAIRAKRDDPTCHPSIRTICRDACVGTETACRAVQHLEQMGLLTIERRRGRSNIYHLTVSTIETPTVSHTKKVAPHGACFDHRNSKGQSVSTTETQPFRPSKYEKESPNKPFRVQGEHVGENDSEVPY